MKLDPVFLATAAVGAAATWWLWPAPDHRAPAGAVAAEAPAETAPMGPSRPAIPPPEPQDTGANDDALHIAALRAQIALARERLEAWTGDPDTWPDPVPRGFAPADQLAIFDAIAEEWDGGELSLEGTYCEAYPCILVVRAERSGLAEAQQLHRAADEACVTHDAAHQGQGAALMGGVAQSDDEDLVLVASCQPWYEGMPPADPNADVRRATFQADYAAQ